MVRNRYSDLDSAVDDYTAWYVNNRERMNESNSSGMEQQIRFLNAAVDGSLFLIHMLRNELRAAQGRTPSESAILFPVSFR